MAINIEDYTNQIQDGPTRRGVYDLAYQMTEGNHTFKINGTTVTSTATELNLLDGVSRTAVEADQRCFNVQMNNVSVAKSVYATVPWAGDITTIYVVLNDTTVGPLPETFSFGTSLVGAANLDLSGNTIAVTTGTTAATGSSVSVTASAASVTAGSIMKFSTDGFSTGPTMNAVFTVLMDIT